MFGLRFFLRCLPETVYPGKNQKSGGTDNQNCREDGEFFHTRYSPRQDIKRLDKNQQNHLRRKYQTFFPFFSAEITPSSSRRVRCQRSEEGEYPVSLESADSVSGPPPKAFMIAAGFSFADAAKRRSVSVSGTPAG